MDPIDIFPDLVHFWRLKKEEKMANFIKDPKYFNKFYNKTLLLFLKNFSKVYSSQKL